MPWPTARVALTSSARSDRGAQSSRLQWLRVVVCVSVGPASDRSRRGAPTNERHAKGAASFHAGAPENGDRTRTPSLHGRSHHMHNSSRPDRAIAPGCDAGWAATLVGCAEGAQPVLLRPRERIAGLVALAARPRVHALVRASVVLEVGSRPLLVVCEATSAASPWAGMRCVLSTYAVLVGPGLGWPCGGVARPHECVTDDSIIAVIYSHA